jgi:hypothetical protein
MCVNIDFLIIHLFEVHGDMLCCASLMSLERIDFCVSGTGGKSEQICEDRQVAKILM